MSRFEHSAFDPKSLFLFPCQIAQFDCDICTREEADEARTDRDNPRRIDIGQNPDVDEPSLQHSTAKCTGKPKNDPKNKDERRLQSFFHYRSQRVGSRIHHDRDHACSPPDVRRRYSAQPYLGRFSNLPS